MSTSGDNRLAGERMKKLKVLLVLCCLMFSAQAWIPRSLVITSLGWNSGGVGKYTDYLAERAHIVVRSQSLSEGRGNNIIRRAGDGFNLMILPSGVLRKNTQCYLTAGMEIDPEILFKEIELLKSKNKSIEGRLWISSRAQVIMPYHKKLDELIARWYRNGTDEGSRKGLGAAAADKRLRIGIRVADLIDPVRFKEVLRDSVDFANQLLTKIFEEKPFVFEEVYKEYSEYANRIRPYVKHDLEIELNKLILQGKAVIFEGCQGAFLDISMGCYPYVSSSSTTTSGIITGAGVGPRNVGHVLGIVQSYNTLIGKGPMPAEIKDKKVLDKLKKAHSGYCEEIEDMRYGWVDLVLIREAILINGIDSLAISKLDELDTLDEIKICYDYVLDKKNYDYLPPMINHAKKIEPRYITMPGWKTSTRNARSLSDLPEAARAFVKKIELLTGAPISFVSVGPERDQMIVLDDQLLPL